MLLKIFLKAPLPILLKRDTVKLPPTWGSLFHFGSFNSSIKKMAPKKKQVMPRYHQLLLPHLNSHFGPLNIHQNSHLKNCICCMGGKKLSVDLGPNGLAGS